MFDSFFGKDWAMPATSKPWAAVASVTEWIKKASRYKMAVQVHHFAWERSHGDKSRQHPWQDLGGS